MQTVLTDREAEIMGILWEQGPSTVAEVRAQLPDKPAYTTVLTILRILETKEFIGHAEEGRAHRYAARVGREAARRNALQALSKKFFNGSAAMLLTHLVSEQKLTREEVRRIRALLAKQTSKDKP
jgi:predicted transcriptional regulator